MVSFNTFRVLTESCVHSFTTVVLMAPPADPIAKKVPEEDV